MITLIKRVSGGGHVRKYISRILDHRDLSTNIDEYLTEKFHICRPTGPKMTKLTEEERKEVLTPLLSSGWEVHPDRDAIYNELLFVDFSEAFKFIAKIAFKAEKMNHYPEWFNVSGRVRFIMFSHDINGLSQRDVKLATFINETWDVLLNEDYSS